MKQKKKKMMGTSTEKQNKNNSKHRLGRSYSNPKDWNNDGEWIPKDWNNDGEFISRKNRVKEKIE